MKKAEEENPSSRWKAGKLKNKTRGSEDYFSGTQEKGGVGKSGFPIERKKEVSREREPIQGGK